MYSSLFALGLGGTALQYTLPIAIVTYKQSVVFPVATTCTNVYFLVVPSIRSVVLPCTGVDFIDDVDKGKDTEKTDMVKHAVEIETDGEDFPLHQQFNFPPKDPLLHILTSLKLRFSWPNKVSFFNNAVHSSKWSIHHINVSILLFHEIIQLFYPIGGIVGHLQKKVNLSARDVIIFHAKFFLPFFRANPTDCLSLVTEYSDEEKAEVIEETMEQYMSKTRTDYGSGVARPKIEEMDSFELKGQFLKELQENTFSGSDNDANEHIEKVLEFVDLFYVPNITEDQVMLRVFPISLTGSASRWLRNEPTISIKTSEDLKTKFSNKYYPPGRTAKKMEEINNFQQEPDETLYQAWERFKELLMKCPQHYLTEMQELRRSQGDDLMPTIKEGEVIEEFKTRDEDLDTGIDDYPSYCDSDKKIHIDCAHNLKFLCMIGFEFTNVNFFPLFFGRYGCYRDEGIGRLFIVGERASHPSLKTGTNEQADKIPSLLKVSEKDKKNGISALQSKSLEGPHERNIDEVGGMHIFWNSMCVLVLYKVEDIATCLVEYVKFWDDWEVDRYGNANLAEYGVSTSIGYDISNFLSNTTYSFKLINTAYPLPLDTAYRSSGTETDSYLIFTPNFFLSFFRTNPTDCLSLEKEFKLFRPYKEPEREFRSSRRHFKSLSLDELRSFDFNLFSDQEYLEEEEAKAMAETMEQYMSKTRTDYGSGVARPKIEEKYSFELKSQFLKELRENTFSGSDNEDAHEHIEKVLEIVDLFHVPNITEDQLML
ncbi:hypothetical protein Tco_1244034 [Tanacetum coccineum]